MAAVLNPDAKKNLDSKKVVEIDYSAIIKSCLLDPDIDVPEPDIVLSVKQDGFEIPVFTKGSISGIIGKAKGGKTTFVALLTAAVVKQELAYDQILLSSTAAGKIIFFDTEQGSYYGHRTYKKILELSANKLRLKYFDLRLYNPGMRLNIINEVLKQEDEIAMVVIDGGRDIIYDINSPEEAITIISELMTLSVKHDTHICIILHQNKGDNNARGHFGTELVNKSETIISINKSNYDRNIAIIEADYTRGMPFEPMALGRNDDGLPFLMTATKSHTAEKSGRKALYPTDLSDETHQSIIKSVFAKENGLLYSKAYNAIKTAFGMQGTNFGESKAKHFLEYYLQNGWVTKVQPSKGNTLYQL